MVMALVSNLTAAPTSFRCLARIAVLPTSTHPSPPSHLNFRLHAWSCVSTCCPAAHSLQHHPERWSCPRDYMYYATVNPLLLVQLLRIPAVICRPLDDVWLNASSSAPQCQVQSQYSTAQLPQRSEPSRVTWVAIRQLEDNSVRRSTALDLLFPI
ncbi:hypothetical protein H257_00037 [Aphanomyces astaci]|uniref:Uncharacterized protein n=1 Tax=Aphanomyces astaci TaxID=112090 RepID=W4HAV9_APHAT|nr:hypothetical protein H257_00037 [Aphanomyces astaci]ETV88419.1 hypothetical protein H257_00037 [Aphanomyces astaci]|eukprot:XP_009820819.1 hypothetical protein H257_00037 [Aphanomyces astaci]